MRLIDADALEKSLTEKGADYTVSMFATSDDCNIARLVAFECAEEVKNAPAIEAEPVRHGKWVWVRDKHNYPMGMKCSECGRRVKNLGENYCPKCGAKMDLEE